MARTTGVPVGTDAVPEAFPYMSEPLSHLTDISIQTAWDYLEQTSKRARLETLRSRAGFS